MQVMRTWTKLKLFRASSSCPHNSCHSFGLNVYSSSKHTNCNYLRAQTTSYPCSSNLNTRNCSWDYVVRGTNTFNKNHISGYCLVPGGFNRTGTLLSTPICPSGGPRAKLLVVRTTPLTVALLGTKNTKLTAAPLCSLLLGQAQTAPC